MRGKRLWTKILAHGGVVKVYVMKSVMVDGDECDAAYFPETNEICVAQGDANFMRLKLMHELLHVVFSAHTGDALNKVLIGETLDERVQHEEQIVGFIEPVLYDILMRNKMLRIPKPPKV